MTPTTPLEHLAIAYHKATDGAGEGEYGCNGLTCPGVQRLLVLLRAAVAPIEKRLAEAEGERDGLLVERVETKAALSKIESLTLELQAAMRDDDERERATRGRIVELTTERDALRLAPAVEAI